MNALWKSLRAYGYEPEDILRHFNVEEPPVDVFAIARAMGAEIWNIADQGWTAALDARVDPPRIFLREGDAYVRRRFSVAHELGHLMLHEPGVLFRDTTMAPGSDPREIQANDFAARLLMPTYLIRSEMFYVGEDPAALARSFHVSPTSMRYRLDNLRRGVTV